MSNQHKKHRCEQSRPNSGTGSLPNLGGTKNMTVDQFKTEMGTGTGARLAAQLFIAMAFAKAEKERVAGYIPELRHAAA